MMLREGVLMIFEAVKPSGKLRWESSASTKTFS